MLISILLLYNLILGMLLRELIYNNKNKVEEAKPVKIMRYILGLLDVSSYVLQIILVIQNSYKLALCVAIICVSVTFAMNQIFMHAKTENKDNIY